MVTDSISKKGRLKKFVNEKRIKMQDKFLSIFFIEIDGYVTLKIATLFLFCILAFFSIAFSRVGIRLHDIILCETGEVFTCGPVHCLALSLLFLSLLAFFYFKILNIYKKLSPNNFNYFIFWIFTLLSTSLAFYSFVALFFKIYIDSDVHLNVDDYFSLLGVLMTFLFVVITYLSIREYKKTNAYSSSSYEIELIGKEIIFYQTLVEYFKDLHENVKYFINYDKVINFQKPLEYPEINVGKGHLKKLKEYYYSNSCYDIDEFTKEYFHFFPDCERFYKGELVELDGKPDETHTSEGLLVNYSHLKHVSDYKSENYDFLTDTGKEEFLSKFSYIHTKLTTKITSKQEEQAKKYKEFKSNLNR